MAVRSISLLSSTVLSSKFILITKIELCISIDAHCMCNMLYHNFQWTSCYCLHFCILFYCISCNIYGISHLRYQGYQKDNNSYISLVTTQLLSRYLPIYTIIILLLKKWKINIYLCLICSLVYNIYYFSLIYIQRTTTNGK